MRGQVLITILALALTLGCAKHPAYEGPFTSIATGPGPEDLALDTTNGMRRVIIPCAERRKEMPRHLNGFYAYDLNSERLLRLAVIGLPKNITLNPHGIDIGPFGGETCLFAVNHEDEINRQSILVFALHGDTLQFKDSLIHPLLVSPNDVCTDHRSGLYVSNDSGKRNALLEKLFAQPKSNVIHFDGTQWRVAASGIKFANGVGVKNGKLYVTGTQESVLLSFSILENGLLGERTDYAVPYGSDNITFSGDKLISTAHLSFYEFTRHASKASHPSPGLVYAIDLSNGKVDTLFYDNGANISAISTGLWADGHLYVAQVFNPFVLRLPIK